jgi:hypothetical protein
MPLVEIDPTTVPAKENEHSDRIQEALSLLAKGKWVGDEVSYPDAAAARKACNHILVSLYRYRKLGRVGAFVSRTWTEDGTGERAAGSYWRIVPKDAE